MIIDINFFNGGINKYRRNRSLKIKEDDITISKTMFLDGYNLFDLAKKLKLVDLVEEISYQEYSRGNQLNKEGSTVFWYNPPRKFPEKTFNGKPVKFLCPFCENNDNGIGHKDSCVLQKKFLLICHPTWVEQNRQDLENSNLIDNDGNVLYTKLPNCEIKEKRPTVVNRITIKRKYGNSYAYFHIYDNLRIRIEKLPFTKDWEREADWIIDYLNRYEQNLFYEKIEFYKDYSFVSQIVENKRLFDKNDNNLRIKIDSKKVSKSSNSNISDITTFKTRFGETNRYTVNVTYKYFSFKDIFLEIGNVSDEIKDYYKKLFEDIGEIVKQKLVDFYNAKRTGGVDVTLNDYKYVFDQNFIELKEIIHSTGAIQRFYKTLTFEQLYLNILFLDCLYDHFEITVDDDKKIDNFEKEVEKFKEEFAINFVENFKLENLYLEKINMTNLEELDKYIISNREIKIKSVKHCLKPVKGKETEPPSTISDKSIQPFKRGLFPYSFKGRVLFQDTIVDHKGFQKNGLYYPTCIMATKPSLKTYIKALIQGFPKDKKEAKKYDINWNNGKPVDNNSAVKPKCEKEYGYGRIIEENGRVIKPLGKIDIEKFKKKFEECAKEKSSQLNGSKEVNIFEFSFLRPLTIDKLFTISNKKIASQAIPEESLIAYCYKGIVYYMFKGKTLMAPYDCKEDGHGFILNKEFFPMDYNKCECRENILQYCEASINRSLHDNKIDKILIFTEEGEGFYWNSNGYKELMCNVNIKPEKGSYKLSILSEYNEPFPIQLAPSTKVNKKKNFRSTLKEFPRNFFYKYDTIKKNTRLDKLRTKRDKTIFGGQVLVNGVYNDFGKLYWGTPLNQVKRKIPGFYNKNTFLNMDDEEIKKREYKTKIKQLISNKGLNEKYIKSCFRRKNIENFIKIASPIEIDFFIKSSTLFNLKLKIFKINVPFSNENNLKWKILNFTSQFINKTIDNFEQSAVIFYDDGNSIKYHYSQ